jgi:hypothetical protein
VHQHQQVTDVLIAGYCEARVSLVLLLQEQIAALIAAGVGMRAH